MSDDKSAGLTNLVNASGFLLQLAVEYKIRQSSSRHNWEVLSSEHPWRDPQTGQEGFIDLVVALGAYRLVIECKRPQDSDWVFIVPADQKASVARVRSRWVRGTTEDAIAGWDDFRWAPPSFESAFCVIRGTGESDRPMLERLADVLLTSMDSLVDEELKLSKLLTSNLAIYVPMVVTTARLSVIHVNPEDVSLADGKISAVQCEQVPIVRFRKSLSTVLSDGFSPDDLKCANEHKGNTS